MKTKKMYALLCGAASDALDALDRNQPLLARKLLQEALLKAEELYIQSEEDLQDDEQWDALMKSFARLRGDLFIQENHRLLADPTAAVPDRVRQRMAAPPIWDNE